MQLQRQIGIVVFLTVSHIFVKPCGSRECPLWGDRRDDRLVYSPTTGYSPTVDVWICCCDLSIAVVRRTGNDLSLAVFRVIGINYFLPFSGSWWAGHDHCHTLLSSRYSPYWGRICPRYYAHRGNCRTDFLAMLWGALKTEAFYWLAIVPFLGFLTCVLINWEPLGANVDAEDAEVLAELKK